jgi:hypothetical protein
MGSPSHSLATGCSTTAQAVEPFGTADLMIIATVELQNARMARLNAEAACGEMEELIEAVRRDYLAFVSGENDCRFSRKGSGHSAEMRDRHSFRALSRSGPRLAEGAEQFLVHELISSDDLFFDEDCVAAVEIGGKAAGLSHHQNAGSHIPRREIAFPIDIEPPSRHPRQIEGCGAKPAQSDDPLLDYGDLPAE